MTKGMTSLQPQRFVETARELGADTDGDALDQVFGKVVSTVLPKEALPTADKSGQRQRPAKGS